jgi:hypothetical protein
MSKISLSLDYIVEYCLNLSSLLKKGGTGASLSLMIILRLFLKIA